MKTTRTIEQIEKAKQDLRELLNHAPNGYVSTLVKYSSAETHKIKFFCTSGHQIVNITEKVAIVLNLKLDKNWYAVFGGGGTNHRIMAVQDLSEELDLKINHSYLADV